jgi:recombination protein RecT
MRTEKLLYPQREPVKTRPAATILLMRENPLGPSHQYEILMTKRSETASFAPGVYVFPGGVVDAADQTGDELSTFALAAVREAFEELGVLLARKPDGNYVDQALLSSLTRQPKDGFLSEMKRHSLVPALSEVKWLCHWITDRDLPKRFDVRFYIASMPEGQAPIADEAEQFEPTWISPTVALERYKAGTLKLIFPTIRTLERLAAFKTQAETFSACENGPLFSSCPRAGLMNGEDSRHMEYEPVFGELEMVSPDGQIAHGIEWNHEKPRALAKHIQRLTAPNASVMTGPGTNTYIIGEGAEFAVVDPGPLDEVHINRIVAAVGTGLKYILCTHSHPDHSPGAKLLKEKTGGTAVIAGLKSLPTARAYSEFTPEMQVVDGQVFKLGNTTLRVVLTPGHAANHCCFVIEEDKLLISGDHILNGSTTIVDPPDGNMNDYINSLDVLYAQDIEYILPAHGYVLGPAKPAIAHLKKHRLAREAKVIAAMKAVPNGSLEDWVKHAYADTDSRLHGIALRSLTAHVERVRELGLV